MARPSEVPDIVVNGRQQREVIADAWDALLASAHGDDLFLYGGRLVRLARSRRGEATAETVSTELLTALLRRSASWLREKDGEGHVDTPVPRDIALDMLALPSPEVPVLERILRAPALGVDGALLRSDGYHPTHRAFLDLPQILADLPATPMPLVQAVAWLRDELLADFPFVAEADRTHAVAALVLPFVRPAIDGPTPLHLIEAPTEGTGKSLLADAIVRVTSGRSSQPTTVPRGDDATRKKLTAILAEAPVAVVLDNLAGLVDSASLAAVLTATTWADRRLGETQMLALPNHALWIATGNNPMLSREIARRAVRVRLDAGSATPWTGRTYRHANLARWTDAHRRELVGAALGLVQAWVDAGQPEPERSLGSFESWARVVGGIVTHAGFGGFLGGDTMDVAVDPEEAEWAALVAAWAEELGEQKVPANAVFALAGRRDLAIGAPDGSERATRTRFGRALAQRRMRVYGAWRVCDGVDAGRKQKVYWLAPAG
jgi:putative DNA primase/helicase